MDEEGVYRPAWKVLNIEVWSNEVVEEAHEIAKESAGASSGVREGSLRSEEVEAHDRPWIEANTSRTKK